MGFDNVTRVKFVGLTNAGRDFTAGKENLRKDSTYVDIAGEKHQLRKWWMNKNNIYREVVQSIRTKGNTAYVFTCLMKVGSNPAVSHGWTFDETPPAKIYSEKQGRVFMRGL
jgi:hypothetical protein